MQIRWTDLMTAKILSPGAKPLQSRFRLAFIHPETGQFLAFMVTFAGMLAPSDVETWGKKEVHVPRNAFIQPSEIVRLQEMGYRHCLLNEKRVLSKSGRNLGLVRDFTYDTQTNRILNIHVFKGLLFFLRSHRIFTYEQIDHISPKAIHLNIEPEAKVKADTKRAFWRRLSMRSI